MDRFERMSALFWVGMGIAICVESIRLGVGQVSDPGPGLIPLGCGIVLGIFGSIVFIRTFIPTEGREDLSEHRIRWRKLTITLASLIGYAFLLDFVGFRLVTLLWMVLMCRLGKIGWKASVFISIITTFSCYILFGYLGIRFPRGVFGF
jgi:putative tricarboxylic transport membrane protein